VGRSSQKIGNEIGDKPSRPPHGTFRELKKGSGGGRVQAVGWDRPKAFLPDYPSDQPIGLLFWVGRPMGAVKKEHGQVL